MTWQPAGPALLFCPADRPERFAKAALAADVVVLDLEDGVAPPDKEVARLALRHSDLDPAHTIVRINPAGTADHALDLMALATTAYDVIMLAKSESPDEVNALSPRQVVALCETPRGIAAASELARCDATVALMWGAEDLVAALGGRSSRHPNGAYRDIAVHSRSVVLLAAGVHDIAAIDSVYLDIADLEGLRREAVDAAASGFSTKACIHPSQVPVVRAAFAPTEEEVLWARRLLDAVAGNRGVFKFEGRMVDAPIVKHAHRVLAWAQPSS